ncbi:hypothetical protein VP424E501_P0037 [Vibrio phage 424E50-1]|nr:hypothetical protein VP424E501_P0037 [Vibrio phage 424E50-1]
MKFDIEVMKNSVPFCVSTVFRTEEELKELEYELTEYCGFKIFEEVNKVKAHVYYGVDSDKELIGYDTVSHFSEDEAESEVSVFEWSEILLNPEEKELEGTSVKPDSIPPVGTMCRASVFGKSELVTGEIIKTRHNGTREVAAIMDSEPFEVNWSHKFYPIPKELTWKEQIEDKFGVEYSEGHRSFYFRDRTVSEDTLLEMCRIVLRAKGELK